MAARVFEKSPTSRGYHAFSRSTYSTSEKRSDRCMPHNIGAATVGYVGVRTPTKIVRQLTDTHKFCFVPPALWSQVDVWIPTLFRTLLRHCYIKMIQFIKSGMRSTALILKGHSYWPCPYLTSNPMVPIGLEYRYIQGC
jgi:hypothetical protein